MLVDIDRKEQAGDSSMDFLWRGLAIRIMFAATFLLMWIFTLPGDSIEKKPDIDTIVAVLEAICFRHYPKSR
nr:hypothetical protein [Escherichia coli]